MEISNHARAKNTDVDITVVGWCTSFYKKALEKRLLNLGLEVNEVFDYHDELHVEECLGANPKILLLAGFSEFSPQLITTKLFDFAAKIPTCANVVFAGPIIRYNYEISDSLELNLGGQFVGNRWNTEAIYGGNLEERNFRYRSYRINANIQWNFDENHSVFVGGGYDFAGEVEIESASLNSDRDVDNGGFFEAGYQYRF